MMNKDERQRIVHHALTIMRFYKQFKLIAGDNQWKHLSERQAYRDCLESLKKTKFITDYNLAEYTVTFPDGTTINA